MEMISFDNRLRILCVNDDIFMHNSSKLVSYDLKAILNQKILGIINYLSQPKILEELLAYLKTSNYSALESNKADEIIEHLISRGFLRKFNDCTRGEGMWQSNGWREALHFHCNTNRLPKLQYNTPRLDKDDVNYMEQYVSTENSPSNYKRHNGKCILLDRPSVDGKYKIVTTASRTRKIENITFQLLSRLLFFAFGQIGDRYMKVTGKHVRKTSPSGGSRHPIEAYLFIKKEVYGINPGIYHYNVKNHALSLIKEYPAEFIDKIIRSKLFLDEKRGQFEFSLAIIYSCIFERSMFRYRESRSYRVMQFDLGHLTQNLYFLAKSYGLNFYSGYSCLEKEIEDLIGIDHYLESCMGYTVI